MPELTSHHVLPLYRRAVQFTLDLDGAMDETDTGPNYSGPPVRKCDQ